MTAVDLALQPGDRFRVYDDDRVHTAVKVFLDPYDDEALFVWTSLDEPPLWIAADDVEEIVL